MPGACYARVTLGQNGVNTGILWYIYVPLTHCCLFQCLNLYKVYDKHCYRLNDYKSNCHKRRSCLALSMRGSGLREKVLFFLLNISAFILLSYNHHREKNSDNFLECVFIGEITNLIEHQNSNFYLRFLPSRMRKVMHVVSSAAHRDHWVKKGACLA